VPLRKELHGRLKAVSEAKDLPMISLIRIAVSEYIEREAARE
jgi:predicted transcriptional regulator